MQNPINVAIILWASYFDELATVSFAYEFRQMGLPVTLVAIHNSGEQENLHVVTPSKQNLEETIAQVDRIACLVIPSSAAALGQFQQNPLLWRLIAAVHENGGRIVIGRSEGVVEPGIADLLPPSTEMITYPNAEKLLLFARWLAHDFVVGGGLGVQRQDAKVPPLIRVANDSNPASVAGAIAGIVRDYGYAEVQSIGAAAGNQMLKAATIAKSYLAVNKLALFIMPDFFTVHLGGSPRSAIRLFVSAWPTGMDNRISWEQVQTLATDDVATDDVEDADN